MHLLLCSAYRNLTPEYLQIKRLSCTAECLVHRHDWRTARDSVDIVMTDADRTDLECISVIPYVSIRFLINVGSRCCFFLGAEWDVAVYSETNLTLTSVLKRERGRGGKHLGVWVTFSLWCWWHYLQAYMSQRPTSHPHLASNPRIFIVGIKSWIYQGSFKVRASSQRWGKKYGSSVKRGQTSCTKEGYSRSTNI